MSVGWVSVVLSIGKLGAGHHAYYELSVATGAEDYYTGRGEARGWYLGQGAEALGLNGEVEAGDLKHLFRGTHPQGGEPWVRRRACGSFAACDPARDGAPTARRPVDACLGTSA